MTTQLHWSAEENNNYDPPWVLRFNPTPGGRKNEDGSTTLSMTFPALQVTDWVGDAEKSARDIANTLNSYEPISEALRAICAEFAQGHPLIVAGREALELAGAK